jgi:hypothetical protein
VIAHWDNDDSHAPDRLKRQVAVLAQSGAAICGLSAIAFLAEDDFCALDLRFGGAGPSRS